jgi:hypothetical protein
LESVAERFEISDIMVEGLVMFSIEFLPFAKLGVLGKAEKR